MVRKMMRKRKKLPLMRLSQLPKKAPQPIIRSKMPLKWLLLRNQRSLRFKEDSSTSSLELNMKEYRMELFTAQHPEVPTI